MTARSRILVADDDPISRMTVQEYLEASGYSIVAVADGEEALAALDKECFDLLILDMLMPNKDGIEVILELRKRGDPIKILAVSSGGRMDKQSLLRPAIAFGATATAAKPLMRTPLVALVSTLLDASARP